MENDKMVKYTFNPFKPLKSEINTLEDFKSEIMNKLGFKPINHYTHFTHYIVSKVILNHGLTLIYSPIHFKRLFPITKTLTSPITTLLTF